MAKKKGETDKENEDEEVADESGPEDEDQEEAEETNEMEDGKAPQAEGMRLPGLWAYFCHSTYSTIPTYRSAENLTTCTLKSYYADPGWASKNDAGLQLKPTGPDDDKAEEDEDEDDEDSEDSGKEFWLFRCCPCLKKIDFIKNLKFN
jgi:hypothetical protein